MTQESIGQKPKEKWYKRWWGILLLAFGATLILLFLIFLGLVFYYYRQIKSGKMPLPSSAKFMRAASATNTVTPEQLDPVRIYPEGEPSSSPGAPLTIVGFFDFQCSFSKEVSPIVRELQSIYGNKVNFVFRNFPLSEMHPQAMLAAQAGECAHEQNNFWPMYDKLFLNQDFSGKEDFKLYAQQIGLDEIKFSDCLASNQSRGQVLKDFLDGQLLGVRGTPTWFINNEKIEGAIPLNVFKKIIDYLLAQQK
jgi:protein-disulfide isomerase